MLPLLPLAISGGFALADYLSNKGERDRLKNLKFPKFDVGAKRKAALSRIGERTARTGRSASKTLSARGLGGTTAEFNVGGQIAGRGGQQAEQAFANIQEQMNRWKAQQAQFEMMRANAINQAPGFSDALATGVSAYGALEPLMNPEQFVPQFNQGQQPQQPPQLQQPQFQRQPTFQQYQPPPLYGGRV